MIRTIILLQLCAVTSFLFAGPSTTVSNIHVDQFGYREPAEKIAVISQAQVGSNAPETFTPGAQYELKRWSDDVTVYTGDVIAWNSGATHGQSGDKAWHFDFSSYQTNGTYYVWDPSNNVGSYKFAIDNDVYNVVLKHAMRTFFYQRSGFAKEVPYAEAGWADGASHLGPEQDLDSRDAKNPVASTSRDLRGGWYDAGDFNKYMNYADETVNDLLEAYEENPDAFSDDYNIPESGNGIEDILDEVKWELDWMLRMQEANGSCIHKVSVTCFCAGSPPSTDDNARRYLAPTISATISGCATYAHAALVYKNHSNAAMQAYGATLEAAAIAAWDYIKANEGDIPSNADNTGFDNGAIEDNEYGQRANLVGAAAFLFGLTGDSKYSDHLDAVWNSDYIHLREWYYAYVFESQYQDALLYYADLPNATSSVASEIRSRYTGSISGDNHLAKIQGGDDAYLSYAGNDVYGWGSSRNKCHQGGLYYSMNRYGLDASNQDDYANAAESFIHYMHGVNPLNLTYLTNMGDYGAENSCTEFYHAWFTDGSSLWDKVGESTYGPPPGYVPGGANPGYAPDAACTCTSFGEPIQKSYKDWNASWPENSWEVTENSITYQAAYVRLLSHYASDAGSVTGIKSQKANGVNVLDVIPSIAGNQGSVSGWSLDGSLTLCNANGQIIHSTKVAAGESHDLPQNLTPGVYIIHVSTTQGGLEGKYLVE